MAPRSDQYRFEQIGDRVDRVMIDASRRDPVEQCDDSSHVVITSVQGR
jgi:hypothetical protein